MVGIPNGIIYCQSFEKIISLSLCLHEELKDLYKVFPIFNTKCNIVFKSLTTFSVSSSYFKNLEYLTNMYKKFRFNSKCKKSIYN